ncbi:YfgM family protein [Hydrogenophaga sp. OTU3427]|uniref:YfgM family protein n=1 Tax=Hydrogenophaga sp. OTU3427 TaxID=3043856 RepID=UPI00313E4413
MASHLDLEEQEQLDQLKHFWAKYGNLITWALIVVLGAFAAWNGWQYWQNRNAVQAAALYDELERAAQARDAERVLRVWGDMQNQYPGTLQAAQGGLLAARALHDTQKADEAQAALQWVADKASDDAYQALARIRLAGVLLDKQAFDQALKVLDAKMPPSFASLAADRRGDVLLAQGQRDAAKAQYQAAYRDMAAETGYRRLIEAKLAALGVEVGTDATQEKTP